ncbi:MAG: PDZ domain-containing protein [Anaerolineae bacterium]|nr:PDZ domain-containing protein [Anaerolineae bacterium]
MSITVYTTPTCGFCHQVKDYLNRRGVPFVEHDVSQEPQAAAEMVRVSGQQGVPVVLIDGQVIVGADMARIDQLLAQRTSRPPRLGVAIAEASRIASTRGIDLPDGAYVGRVNPGSPAAMAGLLPDDVIIQLAGQPVRSDKDVHRLTAGMRHDETADVLIWRSGQTIGTKLRL